MNKAILFFLSFILIFGMVAAKKPSCNPSNACDRIEDIWDYLDDNNHACSNSCESQVNGLDERIDDLEDYIDSHESSWDNSNIECRSCPCDDDEDDSSVVNNYYSSSYLTNIEKRSGLSRSELGKLVMNDSDYFYEHESMIEEFQKQQEELDSLRREFNTLYDQYHHTARLVTQLRQRWSTLWGK